MAYSDYPYVAKVIYIYLYTYIYTIVAIFKNTIQQLTWNNFQQQKCHFDKHRSIVNVSSWAILPARDERALEIAIAKIGPVAASINASPHTFQLYQ